MIKLNLDLYDLEECKVSINEFFTILKIKYPEIDFSFTPIHYKNVMDKGFIYVEKSKLYLTTAGEQLIETQTVNVQDYITDLAQSLRDLYPAGKKGGIYYWRGSNSEIKRKLETFFKKYGTKYSPDEIIKATERYVKSFDDTDRDKAMMLLKYFIEKNGTSTLTAQLQNISELKDIKINYGNERAI